MPYIHPETLDFRTYRVSKFQNTTTWVQQAERCHYKVEVTDDTEYLIAYNTQREPVGAMPQYIDRDVIQNRGWLLIHV